ncbi:unnamed protein product [Onchocerca flexuosa]|nr:unnamed protein product [Onchocerca flexuosa]
MNSRNNYRWDSKLLTSTPPLATQPHLPSQTMHRDLQNLTLRDKSRAHSFKPHPYPAHDMHPAAACSMDICDAPAYLK